MLIPTTQWAQGVWVARKDEETIYLVPSTHVVGFDVKWRDTTLDYAIQRSDVAYVENTGIQFDLNDFPKYDVPEYERLSDKARVKLEDACSRLQKYADCYKTWHPYFAYITILNSAMSNGATTSQVGLEQHVISRLKERRVGIRSLEYPDEIFATVSRASNAAIIESTNRFAETSVEANTNGTIASTHLLHEGDDIAMQQDILVFEKNYFSGDFFEHLVIDRTRNMAKRMLDDPHKSILVLSGYAHFFSRKDNFFSLLEDQGFVITKLKAE